jgi:hypothetical protein
MFLSSSHAKRLDLRRDSKLQINGAETLYELRTPKFGASFSMMRWRLARARRADPDGPT